MSHESVSVSHASGVSCSNVDAAGTAGALWPSLQTVAHVWCWRMDALTVAPRALLEDVLTVAPCVLLEDVLTVAPSELLEDVLTVPPCVLQC